MSVTTAGQVLKRLIAGENLAQDEAASLLEFLISPGVTDGQIAGILAALAAKGEAEAELAGFAEVMRERSSRLETDRSRSFIDTCGTGGSPIKTFNVSTAAAFVVSAAGVPVAKHGNVGVTSRVGSADVLRAMGVRLDLPVERIGEIFHEIGVCFMFAPHHHGATRRVAIIRRELGIRTIFNWVGPLTNPAGAPFQLIGVSDPRSAERMAGALSRLSTRKAWIVRGNDGLDEVTLTGKTTVFEVEGDAVRRFEIAPEDFGIAPSGLSALKGGEAEDNANLVRAVLSGEATGAAQDLVVINAAAALVIAGKTGSLPDAACLARGTIERGEAAACLDRFISATNCSSA